MKENKGSKRKPVIAAVIATALLAAVFLWLAPALHDKACRERVHADMDAQLSSVENARIRVIHVLETPEGPAYSAGASGVIISGENGLYYALTALHVVSDPTYGFIIMTARTPSWAEFSEKGGVSVQDYFRSMPEAEVVYQDEEYDLAVLAFSSADKLDIAERAEKNPAKGDRIALIASRYDSGRRYFGRNFGKVTSSETELFEPDGGHHPAMVLKMNAWITDGSSGGAVYSEEMKLAGMIIGGDFDRLGRFRYGIFMPAEEIAGCLQRWQGSGAAK